MVRSLGPLPVELSQPESAKFTAPLVFVHGLWDDQQSWRRFTGFLSHRGWRCISVTWPAGDVGGSMAARERALCAGLDELENRPIVIGHDIGGLIALRVAERARAAIALAPVGSGATSTLLAAAGTWWQRIRGVARSPARSLAASYPRGGRRTESMDLLSELAAARHVPIPATVPVLIVAGADDPLVPASDARSLADATSAQFEVVAGRHAIHVDDGWESAAGLVHRWIIRSLGEDLLAFYEEAWADREPS